MIKFLRILLFIIVIEIAHINSAKSFVAQNMQEAMSFNNVADSISIEKEQAAEPAPNLPNLHSIYKQAMLPSPIRTNEKPKILNFMESDSIAIKLKQGETFKIILPQTAENEWNFDMPKDFLTLHGHQKDDKKITYEFRAETQGKGMFFLDNKIKKNTVESKILRFLIVKP